MACITCCSFWSVNVTSKFPELTSAWMKSRLRESKLWSTTAVGRWVMVNETA